MDSRRLDGKIAVITGAGRGIGRASAVQLAQAGAAVVVAARTAAEVDETAAHINQFGGRAVAVPTNVADYASVQNLAQETERAFGPADIVVANASVVAPVDQMWKIDPRDWANIVQVNLTGAFFTARAFLPSMMQRKQGILIFVSSGAATHPVVGWGAYCASKAGLDMLAQTLAAESDTAQAGIRVHALYPGIVDTQMQADIRSASTEQFPQVDRYRAYKEKGRLRSPEEPAQMIWWLSTSLTADYHGQILSLDDPAVRERMARDLSTEPLGGR